MKRTAILLFSVACTTISGFLFCTDNDPGPAKAGKDSVLPDTFSVAFYNVENLFDLTLDGNEYEEYRPGASNWTEGIQKTKVNRTAEVIALLDADIVGLCEVENGGVLEQLQTELEKWECGYPYSAVASSGECANTTALLSRYPIHNKLEHEVEQSRSILEVSLDGFRIFVNHWPSKRNPESKRLRAALVLKRRLDELPCGTEYVISGDLNSNYDESVSFHTAGLNDTRWETGINHVLGTTLNKAEYQTVRFVHKHDLSQCADCHYNLWLELPESKRMSYVYRGSFQTLDNILLPVSLFDSTGFSYLDGSFGTFTCRGQLIRNGIPYRWQMRYRGKERIHTGRGYSDHLPIRASFVRAPYRMKRRRSSDPDYSSGPGDFETGTEGWICSDSRFSVSRDSTISRSGRYSLKVSGMHGKANKTAAEIRIPDAADRKTLSIWMKGFGKVSLRIRRSPRHRWLYYNGPGFTESGSARYLQWESREWKRVRLELPRDGKGSEDLYVEIRSGKEEQLSLWIDGVKLE
ncbi:MAG: endonuclease/exonuclease/phosphatase family protein [Fibrobacterota bacterium]